MNDDIIIPKSLKPGDTVAIISPASKVKEEYIDGAVVFLRQKGFNPVVMPSAKGPTQGSFAASYPERFGDLKNALTNPDIKAILCARGGYGCIHLLHDLKRETVRKNPKWLIGFSDISALHALWLKAGVASLHGPMAKHLATKDFDDPFSQALIHILENDGKFDISVKNTPYDFPGVGEGILMGGNLAVLNALASTPYDILAVGENDETILFIEDISEAIYEVERMLARLALSGTLHRIKGLIIGKFTEYRADSNFNTMEEMIHNFLKKHLIDPIPVSFGLPVGHTDQNYPLVEGARVRLTVNQHFTRLQTI